MAEDHGFRPPKRTAIACDNCRKRKRRCNGTRPQCRLCKHLEVDCHYQETATLVAEEGSTQTQLIQRIERIESYLQQQQQQSSLSPDFASQTDAASAVPVDPLIQIGSNHAQYLRSTSYTGQTASPAPLCLATNTPTEEPSISYDENGAHENTMTIPFGHSTTTSSLLHMAQTSVLLGQYPADLFFRVEKRRTTPPELSLSFSAPTCNTDPVFDRRSTDLLVERFFSLVNSRHPVLDPAEFQFMYESIFDQAPAQSVDYALCLVVLALAEIVSECPDTNAPSWQPGGNYFTPALRILIQKGLCSFGTDLALAQGLYLAALYYSYLMRPLLAWKLAHMASTNVQHLWIQYQHDSGQSTNHKFIVRLIWAVFVLECDIIAEYHLPRSGIEHIVEDLPFPECGPREQQYMLFWLANLSSRKLLNRVHHTMYSTATRKFSASTDGASSGGELDYRTVVHYIKVSEELRRQLETWYDYLPPAIKPDLDERSPTSDETMLILRYHASGDIISRPFVLHVCSLPEGSQPPDFVVENCKTCIHHCLKYLDVFENRIMLPSESTEIVLHSALACIIILTTASISPVLKHLIPDLDGIQQKSVAQLERWAFPGSSIKSMLAIARALLEKSRMMQDLYS